MNPFTLLKNWWTRKQRKPIAKEDLIVVRNNKGKLISVPAPNAKQELVFKTNGDIVIRNVKVKKINKKDFGLK